MGFGAGDVVGLICSHPIASFLVALLFTPPLFPIVVFFSPLLISTALVVLAMVSMGSDGDDSGASAGAGYGHSHYKRDWHEHEETDQVILDDDDDGPLLIEEERRVSKRRKAVAVGAHDDGWLDKVKSWEETGRAWVDSVLHQESRKPASLSTSEPLLSAATREVRFARPIPQPLPTPPPVAAAVVDSTENVPPREDAADDRPRGLSGSSDGKRTASEISSAEPEGERRAADGQEEEAIEVPLQRSRGFPLPEPSKVIIDDMKCLDSGEDDSRPKVKWDEEAAPAPDAGAGAAAGGAEGMSKSSKAGAGAAKEQSQAVQSEICILPKEEVGEVAGFKGSSGIGAGDKSSTSDMNDQTRGAAQEPASTSSSSSHSEEGKSGGSSEAAALFRERRGGGEHHRTSSVVVTLSEKLNVPLEDMMSLLAGDEKPSSSSNEAVAPMNMKKGTISHDEGWSSSDDELIRAADKGKVEQTQAEKRSS